MAGQALAAGKFLQRVDGLAAASAVLGSQDSQTGKLAGGTSAPGCSCGTSCGTATATTQALHQTGESGACAAAAAIFAVALVVTSDVLLDLVKERLTGSVLPVLGVRLPSQMQRGQGLRHVERLRGGIRRSQSHVGHRCRCVRGGVRREVVGVATAGLLRPLLGSRARVVELDDVAVRRIGHVDEAVALVLIDVARRIGEPVLGRRTGPGEGLGSPVGHRPTGEIAFAIAGVVIVLHGSHHE